MQRELSEFFGAPVLVQFRDSLSLAEAGEEKQYVVVTESGAPHIGESKAGLGFVSNRMFEPVQQLEKVEDEMLPKFSYVLKGRLLPAPNERVYVLYESKGYIVKAAVHPRDIVAVTSIEGSLEEGRLVKPS